MTASTSEQLAKLVSGVELLMLDFDGPICSVFANLQASVVAARLRLTLGDLGIEITDGIRHESDPLLIYRHSALYGPAVTSRVYDELVAAEVDAVATAAPTAGAIDVIDAAIATGRRIAIVSNNAAEAVETYLKNHQLGGTIDHVAARRTPDPDLMKPNTAYLNEAAAAVGVPPSHCVLVGDSITDIEAGLRAAIKTIGYANRPEKHRRLAAAGASAVVLAMNDLVRPLGPDRPYEG